MPFVYDVFHPQEYGIPDCVLYFPGQQATEIPFGKAKQDDAFVQEDGFAGRRRSQKQLNRFGREDVRPKRFNEFFR